MTPYWSEKEAASSPVHYTLALNQSSCSKHTNWVFIFTQTLPYLSTIFMPTGVTEQKASPYLTALSGNRCEIQEKQQVPCEPRSATVSPLSQGFSSKLALPLRRPLMMPGDVPP